MFRVEGTDAKVSEEFDLGLSERRAAAAASHGVDTKRLEEKG